MALRSWSTLVFQRRDRTMTNTICPFCRANKPDQPIVREQPTFRRRGPEWRENLSAGAARTPTGPGRTSCPGGQGTARPIGGVPSRTAGNTSLARWRTRCRRANSALGVSTTSRLPSMSPPTDLIDRVVAEELVGNSGILAEEHLDGE